MIADAIENEQTVADIDGLTERILIVISILMELAKGNSEIAEQFSRAVNGWKHFHDANMQLNEDDLAVRVTAEQSRHEGYFDGDRHLGKMTMALAAVTALYDEGDGLNKHHAYAVRLMKAFRKSAVSMEVKGRALLNTITAFDLHNEPDLEDFTRSMLGYR